MHDAAAYETVFFQYVLHYFVILMCVDPKMWHLRATIIHDMTKDTLHGSVASYPMHGSLRFL